MEQTNNKMYKEQMRLMFRRQSLEEHKKQEAVRLDRERGLHEGLRQEEDLERKRYLRQVKEELKEKQMENDLFKAEEDRQNCEKQLEEEERKAKEVACINLERRRDEQMRQYIKENSLEIRELVSKLNCAYLNKGRAAQIAAQEAKRLNTKREEEDLACKMDSERQRLAMEMQRLKQQRCEEQAQYLRDLQQQLVDNEQKKQEAYQEFLKEKLLVDEIVKKIYEQDQTEKQLKLEKVKATREYIKEFKKQRAERIRKEHETMEAENRRILEFLSHKEHKEENRMAKIKERETAKDLLLKTLSEKIEGERQQREEFDRVCVELYVEEKEEANRQREIEEMEKKVQQRLMMQQSYHEDLAFKQMRRQAEKEEEEAFRKKIMAKMAEDDRLEQMNAQKRRMKQLEHKREVERLMEDRRRQREADMELEAKEKLIEEEKEGLLKQIVKEERLKILKRHATKLLGYFPKGLLCEDDLEDFDEDFRKNFKPVQADISFEDGLEENEMS